MGMILACYTKRFTRRLAKQRQYYHQHFQGSEESPTIQLRYRENLREHYKRIYHEDLDSIVNGIKDRFDQPAYKLFTQAEQLFLKGVGKQDAIAAMKGLR